MAAKKTPTKKPAGTRARKPAAKKAQVKHAVSQEQIGAIRDALGRARFATGPIAVDADQQVGQLQSALKLCYGAMDEVHALLLQIEGKDDGAGGSGDTPN